MVPLAAGWPVAAMLSFWVERLSSIQISSQRKRER
jgi:hypothetical protein